MNSDSTKKMSKDVSESSPDTSGNNGKPKVSSVVEEIKESILNETDIKKDDDDSLLADDDSNFFWLFQRVIWGVIKLVFLFGIIGIIIWLIWRDGDGAPKQVEAIIEKTIEFVDSKPEKTIKTTQKTITINDTASNVDISDFTKWNAWIEENKTELPKKTFVNCFSWLRKSYNIFEKQNNNNAYWGSTTEERSRTVNSFLAELKALINSSAELREQLANESNAHYAQINHDTQVLKQTEVGLADAFQSINPQKSVMLLKQKIVLQKSIVENTTKLEANKSVLQAMEGYDRALRGMHENLAANKEAVIQNVQVVQFLEDPFRRVITPAEWRSRQD